MGQAWALAGWGGRSQDILPVWKFGGSGACGVKEGTWFRKGNVQHLQGSRLWQALGLETVAGIIIALKDICILIPENCYYVRLHSKGQLKLQMGLKLLIS